MRSQSNKRFSGCDGDFLQQSALEIGDELVGARLLLQYNITDDVRLTVDIRTDREFINILANENYVAASVDQVLNVLAKVVERERASADKVQRLLGEEM